MSYGVKMLEHLPSVPVQKTFVHTRQSELYQHTPLKLKKEKDMKDKDNLDTKSFCSKWV